MRQCSVLTHYTLRVSLALASTIAHKTNHYKSPQTKYLQFFRSTMKLQLCIAAAMISPSFAGSETLQRSIEIKNESGARSELLMQSNIPTYLRLFVSSSKSHPSFYLRLELYWVNDKEMLMQTPNMVNGQSIALNSYVNHTFMVREIPDASGECKVGKYTTPSISPVCRTAYVTVNDHDDQGKM
jgi:hypothetical protein